VCLLAEANRAPFDLAEAESELIGGYHTEYSSMKFALFFLGEYFHIVTGSAFFVLLFMGGWSLNPFTGTDLGMEAGPLTALLQFAIVMGKVTLMVSLTMALRWTLPRFRFDQLMRLSWEGLIPVSLMLLLAVSFLVYFGKTEYMWAASIGVAVLVYMIKPIMAADVEANKRIRLIGEMPKASASFDTKLLTLKPASVGVMTKSTVLVKNTGGVDANAQFTGTSYDHGDVVLASTAIGNGFTGYVCSQCGDAALTGTVSQTNGGNIVSTGSINANGAGLIIGSASAIGNSATFITTQKGH
jgi:hypothetical protein